MYCHLFYGSLCRKLILLACTFSNSSGQRVFLSRSSGQHQSTGATYNVHLGLVGKRVVEFLLVLIKLFSLGVAAEALRAKTHRRLAISLQRDQFDPKFQVEGVAPSIIFFTNS